MVDENKQSKPFDDDCFERKDFAENLLELIKNQSESKYESRVIAIKAGFGLGKTFFAKELMKLIDEDLKESKQKSNDSLKVYCHYVDIWKEDYTNEPLLALLYALENMSDRYQSWLDKSTSKKDMKNVVAVGEAAVSTLFLPQFGEFIARAKNNLRDIREFNKFYQIETYEKMRDNIAKAFQRNKNEKFVIIVDEIDRCMPEYAIRFLETLKHFFDVNGLYFILMLNENHLKKSIKKNFKYINFGLWKDKFIDVEFDLSVFHNQQKFITYLVEQKYNFKDKINNIEMYITYKEIQKYPHIHKRNIETKDLFKDWVSYINKFLNSLDCKLNNRQLDILCLRLNLALNTIGNEKIMPDCLISIILVDMLKNIITRKKLKGKITSPYPFEFYYYDKQDDKVAHILNYFIDSNNKKINIMPMQIQKFSQDDKANNQAEVTFQINNREHFKKNKQAAEFAILANSQDNNANQKEKEQ